MHFLESGLGLYVNKYVLKCQITVTKKKINGVPCLFLATAELFFKVTQIHETRLGVVTTSQRLSDLSGKFVIADTKCPKL